MIQADSRWQRWRHGESLVLRLADAPRAGHLNYTERLAPLRRVRDIAADVVRSYPVTDAGFSPPELVVTIEGEYGAAVVADGRLASGGAARVVTGMVAGEDIYSLLEGIVVDAAHADAFTSGFRELLRSDTLGLGVRRRRYRYDPPPGYQRLREGLLAGWYPADFPRGNGRILVFPASPAPPDAAGTFDGILEQHRKLGVILDDVERVEQARGREGLQGLRWRVRGRRPDGPWLDWDVVVLEDRTYTYASMLETREAARATHLPAFEALISSIHPFPRREHPRLEGLVYGWD